MCKNEKCSNLSDTKRAIITRTPSFLRPAGEKDVFRPSEFEKAIFEKGYDVEHERAIRCACVEKSKNQNAEINDGEPGCKNCNGAGFIFVNKVKTKMLLQRMGRNPSFSEGATSIDEGEIGISASSLDRLSYADKITLVCEEEDYSESFSVYDRPNHGLVGILQYFPLKVDNAYLFVEKDKPLILLKESVDFTIERNVFKLNDSFQEFFNENASKAATQRMRKIPLSIRYKYRPVYFVTDIKRNISSTPVSLVTQRGPIQTKLPQYAIGKKMHYLIDAPDIDGNTVFDNSDYDLSVSRCELNTKQVNNS